MYNTKLYQSLLNIIQKVGQTPRSRSHGQKYRFPIKGSATGNIHVKYQIFKINQQR